MSNKALKTEKGDKVQAARERNRIHSRQTRLRRKARSTNLEGKILELQKEVSSKGMLYISCISCIVYVFICSYVHVII